MRILHITSLYYPELQFGGPPRKIYSLGCGLVAKGHRVEVVTVHSARPLSHDRTELAGIWVQYLPWMGHANWRAPLTPWDIRAAVRRADVVHCFGLYDLLGPTAAFFAARSGKPYLLEPLGMYLPRGRSRQAKTLYNRLCTAPMVRGAARVVATSQAEMEELFLIVGKKQLVLRRNGLDLSLYRDMPDGLAFRARMGVGLGDKLILYVGRISPIKNLEQLIRAYGVAGIDYTKLILVGPMLEPGYAVRLRALIASLQLAGRVVLAGPLYEGEILAALAAADLFVLPSISESFGNAAAEAVAAGVPVLLTDTCGIAPLIHGRAGLAVPRNEAALAAGLRRMLDPGERALLTAQRGQVAKELSWKEPLDQLESLYREVMSNE